MTKICDFQENTLFLQGVHQIVRPNYMAKGSAMGLWRGKKGSTVFYYNKNSNSSMKQAMRERVYEISNPKTRTQAAQRMKVTPMQRVGSALGEILRRSWQGIEYGGKGLQEFRKLALKMTSGYPYVDKGELRAIPGEYVISSGTLTSVAVEFASNKMRLGTPFQGAGTITVGKLSQNLIDAGQAQSGDQLTVVYCQASGTASGMLNAVYNWGWKSFECNPDSTVELSTVVSPLRVTVDTIGGSLNIIALQGQDSNWLLVAGTVIASRPSGNSYMRSRQQLKIDSSLDPWFTDERKRVARLTYQAGVRSSENTNWEVDPMEATSPGLYTISGSSITSLNGTKIWVRYSDETGAIAAVYVTQESGGAGGTPPYVLGENGSQVFYTSGGNENAANPTDCGLGDVPTIAWSGIPTD